MFKSRLIKERDIALQTGHEDNADKLSKRIDEIEARAEKLDANRTQKISSIALINDKNRRQNIERAEAGIRQEMERKKREGEVNDPFTRRKTQPVLATAVLRKKDSVPAVITSEYLALVKSQEKVKHARLELQSRSG